MCAKVKMLTANDLLVNCTKVLKKHKYSNCIHYFPFEDNESITAIELPVAPAKRMKQGLTGNSNQYGKVFNSVITSNSTQPGSLLPLAESSGLPFFDILLTLQGIFYYNFNLVLNTPLEAAYSTPVSSAFFTSKDYPLCSSGKQKYDTRKGNIAGRLLAVFNHSNKPNPLNKGSYEQTRRRPIYG
jgi:hypothetical protein